MKKKINFKYILSLVLILGIFLTSSIVYAKTDSNVHFCEYPGVLRTFKIIGIFITVMKIVVPLIIIITGSISFIKPIISGTVDDLKGNFVQLLKKVIAGLLIFFIPTILQFLFDLAPNYQDTDMSKCTNCILGENCTIPSDNPSIEK